jgi:5-methyltetrahydrofolate--homocysteine methyltransferase
MMVCFDGLAAMQKFVKIAVTGTRCCQSSVSDASKFEIVLAGLKWCKCIVNSISLKVERELFIEQATLLKQHGAAVVVMAFDEEGQAATADEKVRICKCVSRRFGERGQVPRKILFSTLNVLTIGTGMEEHADYAIDFIKAQEDHQGECPRVLSAVVSRTSCPSVSVV